MEANQELSNSYQNSNSVFYFLKRMKKEVKDVEGGRCLKGRYRRLGFIEDIKILLVVQNFNIALKKAV